MALDVELSEIRDFLADHLPFSALSAATLARLPEQLHVEYFRRGSRVIEVGSDNHSLYVVRTGAVEGEFAFDKVPLEGGGVSFLLRGKVDRVDRGIEGPDANVPDAARYVAAIDYKSTKYSTPAGGDSKGWADGIVLQVPLYAAALRALRPGELLARMEYRAIRGPKEYHQLVLAPVKQGQVQDATAAEEKLAQALAAAGGKIAQEVAAEPVDGADPCRIDLGGEVAAPGCAKRGPELPLEIGRGLVGERDRGDLLERQRRREPGDRSTLRVHVHAELMTERLHDRRRLAGAGAGVDEQVSGRLDDTALGGPERLGHQTSTGPPGMRQMSRAGQ